VAVDGVGLDEVLLMRGRRVDALVDRGHRAGRHARPAVDALLGVNVEHRGRREFGLVFSRVDTVHRADVHAGGIFRLNARVSDDERHARVSPYLVWGPELPDLTGRISGPEPTDYTLPTEKNIIGFGVTT